MIDLTNIEGIYLYTFKVDMRKGILGLSILAQDIVPLDEMKKNLFIFCGKQKRMIKVLELDYDGWWLYQKRLIDSKFKWPKDNGKGSLLIDKRQILWLLDGLDVIQKNAHKEEKIKILF